MKPIIGITSDVEEGKKLQLNENYVKAIHRAGGLPFVIPVGIEEDISQISEMLDGLLLTGGADIDPTLFEEEPHRRLEDVHPSRDAIEIELAQKMLELNKPILGICRGEQVLNVAVGGNLYQDIHAQNDKSILQHVQKAAKSHQSHFVDVKEGSLLGLIAGNTKIKVNSFHHQAAKHVPKPFQISGMASDGIVEAIESTEHLFVIGVQWHPEELAANKDSVSLRLFEKFIEACQVKA